MGQLTSRYPFVIMSQLPARQLQHGGIGMVQICMLLLFCIPERLQMQNASVEVHNSGIDAVLKPETAWIRLIGTHHQPSC